MNALIPDIETLKKVVKINSSLPYESIEPYIEDALDIYVKPYVGQSVIKQALTDQGSEIYSKLLRALGPLTLMLATNELGVMFGDTGITVSNVQGQRSPASDSKIAAAKENLCFRGMQALDRLITYFPFLLYPECTRFSGSWHGRHRLLHPVLSYHVPHNPSASGTKYS